MCIPVSVFFSHFFSLREFGGCFFFSASFIFVLFFGVGCWFIFFACYGEQMESWSGPTQQPACSKRTVRRDALSLIRHPKFCHQQPKLPFRLLVVVVESDQSRSYYCTPCRTSERPAVHPEVLALPETTWSCCCRGSHSQWEASGQVRAPGGGGQMSEQIFGLLWFILQVAARLQDYVVKLLCKLITGCHSPLVHAAISPLEKKKRTAQKKEALYRYRS
jgi:hypothetical protein